jgi:hypothetical protein
MVKSISQERARKDRLKEGRLLLKERGKYERESFARTEKERKLKEKYDKERGVLGSRFLTGELSKKLLKKPTAKLPKVSARKAIVSGDDRQRLVREGRTGYFQEELMEEARWLN